MTQIKCLDQLNEAAALIQATRQNIMFRPGTTQKLIARDLAKVKAIVDEANVVFGPAPFTPYSSLEEYEQTNRRDNFRKAILPFVHHEDDFAAIMKAFDEATGNPASVENAG